MRNCDSNLAPNGLYFLTQFAVLAALSIFMWHGVEPKLKTKEKLVEDLFMVTCKFVDSLEWANCIVNNNAAIHVCDILSDLKILIIWPELLLIVMNTSGL